MSGHGFHVHGPHDHEIEHAAHSNDMFSSKIAVMTAIMATVGALLGYEGGATQNQAAMLKNSASIKKTEAANQWSYYQSKSSKQNLAELAMVIPGIDPEKYQTEVTRYKTEKEQIKKEAEALEKQVVELEEASEAASAVYRMGLARAVGCSNYTAPQLRDALMASATRLLTPFQVIESNYNLAVRDIETELLPLARRESLGVITYSPLGAGFLSGKYVPDRAAFPPGSRFDVIPGHADIYFSERNFALAGNLRALAERTGVPATQLALNWVLQNPAVDTVLIGARNIAHLDNALAALRLAPDWYDEMSAW